MLSYTTATQAYRTMEATTSHPLDLVIMLYDGAVGFMSKARAAIDSGNIADKSRYLSKSVAIMEELLKSLNPDVDSEVTANLQELYLYLMKELTEINLTSDAERLDRAVRIVTTLRDAWKEVRAQEKNRTTVSSP